MSIVKKTFESGKLPPGITPERRAKAEALYNILRVGGPPVRHGEWTAHALLEPYEEGEHPPFCLTEAAIQFFSLRGWLPVELAQAVSDLMEAGLADLGFEWFFNLRDFREQVIVEVELRDERTGLEAGDWAPVSRYPGVTTDEPQNAHT